MEQEDNSEVCTTAGNNGPDERTISSGSLEVGKHTEVLETLPDKEECWSIGNSCDGVNFKTSLTQKDSSGSLEVGEQTEVLTTVTMDWKKEL